jgi:hypothetical protein
MQATNTKFYSSKSNAKRAAKQAFGDDFEKLATLVERDGQYAYVDLAAVEDVMESAPVQSKRQADEAAIRVLQDMIAKAESMQSIQVCERAVGDLFKANEITEGVMLTLLGQCSAKVQALADVQANELLVADAAEAKAQLINGLTDEQEAARLKAAAETNPLNCKVCPQCGCEEIFHGVGVNGTVANEDTTGGCHRCDWTFDIGHRRASSIENPCAAVWEIADQFKKANGGALPKRGDVLAECDRQGIAYYTARTQYQLWRTTQKEMEERAAKQGQKA